MIETLLTNLTRALPLSIESVEWNDPVLVVGGESWSFTINSPWRVVSSTALEFGCWDRTAAIRVAELRKATITGVQSQGTVLEVDPVLALSTGHFLALFSVDAVDPWVLRVEGRVYVASPSDANALSDLS